MSRQDEPLTQAGIWWAATLTLIGHSDGRTCLQCRLDGCAQLDWALGQRAGGAAGSVVPTLLPVAEP